MIPYKVSKIKGSTTTTAVTTKNNLKTILKSILNEKQRPVERQRVSPTALFQRRRPLLLGRFCRQKNQSAGHTPTGYQLILILRVIYK